MFLCAIVTRWMSFSHPRFHSFRVKEIVFLYFTKLYEIIKQTFCAYFQTSYNYEKNFLNPDHLICVHFFSLASEDESMS